MATEETKEAPETELEAVKRELDAACGDVDFWYQAYQALIYAMLDVAPLPVVREALAAVETHAAAGFVELYDRTRMSDRYLCQFVELGLTNGMREVAEAQRAARRQTPAAEPAESVKSADDGQ